MNEIYLTIAKKYGVSVAEVRRDMQTAIDEAYKTPSFHTQCVHREGDTPTPEELTAHVVQKVWSGDH